MKRFISVFILTLTFIGAAWAQSGEEVSVRLGQTKSFDRGRISIRFVSIPEDSRCPMNARCVWAGNAKVQLTVTRGRSVRTIFLNSGKGERTATVFGYKFEYGDLTPQKGAPRPMANRPKTVKIFVDKI